MIRLSINISALSFLLVLLSSCGGPKVISEQGNNELEQSTKPSWINQRPINSAYYIGIGSSDKLREPLDYQKVAKKNALNDLSSEIRVVVEGETFLNSFEQNYNFQEEFRSQIKTKVLEDIENFEIVDSWEDNNQYWVYYRLSKAEHARIKKEKKDKALNAAYDLYTKAQDALSNKNFAAAFDMHLRALLEMEDYWAEVNEYLTPDGMIYLDNEIYSSLRDMGTNLSINPQGSEIRLNAQNEFSMNLPVEVLYKGKSVPGISLFYNYQKRSFFRPKSIITDNSGSALIPVNELDLKQKDHILDLWIDLNKLPSDDLDDKITEALIDGIKTARTNLPIVLEYPRLYFISSELMFDATQSNPRLRNSLSGSLSKEGFRIASSPNDADYIFEIESNTTQGGTSQGFHVAYLDMVVSVRNTSTGEEIYKRAFNKLKGLQLNFESAGTEAYKKGIKSLENDVTRSFIDQIF